MPRSHMPKLRLMLQYAIAREADYPPAPQLHTRLKEIEHSARLLIKELTDFRMNALLRRDKEQIENETELLDGLQTIAALAASVRTGSPRKQGRGKLYPESASGPGALELCALMIGLVWEEETREWPGKNNTTAQQTCENFWKRAAGVGGGGADITRWRDHLRAARKRVELNDPTVQYLRRVLGFAPTKKIRKPAADSDHAAHAKAEAMADELEQYSMETVAIPLRRVGRKRFNPGRKD
jgi:hypothetical protein